MIETGIPEIDVDELSGRVQAEVRSRKKYGPYDKALFTQEPYSQQSNLSSTGPSVSALREPGTRRFHIKVSELLKYEDHEFILKAYESILRRRPDSSGFDYFLAHLRSGRLNKYEILGRLRFSSEGQEKGVKVEGLLLRFITRSALRILNPGSMIASIRIEVTEPFMKPIATVIPWFGNDLKGRAEQLAWQLSTRLAQRSRKRKSLQKLKEIHQITPGFTYGDAISNQVILVRDYLKQVGYKSNIYVQSRDPNLKKAAAFFQPGCIAKNAGLIYHRSIGSDLTPHAVAHQGPKCLMYHNITPAELIEPFDPALAERLERGRSELRELAQHFPLSVGDSFFNSQELAAYGFKNPGILPICVDPNKWNIEPDLELMAQLQDGRSNLLFVGRLSPNKRQHELIEAFYHYLTMDVHARLILVGRYSVEEPYHKHIMNTINRLGLQKQVLVSGRVGEDQMQSYYRCAHLFWSMSEHEGFGVPLIESMWFGIPVLAYKQAAVPETLGRARIMFTQKDDLISVAALAKLLVKDRALRGKVVAAQDERRMDFIPEKIFPALDRIIDSMEEMLA